MPNLNDVFESIRITSILDSTRKTASEVFHKLVEEVGELSTELQVSNKTFGSLHRDEGEDGILGEVADCIIAAAAVYFTHEHLTPKDGPQPHPIEELCDKIYAKLNKWKKTQETNEEQVKQWPEENRSQSTEINWSKSLKTKIKQEGLQIAQNFMTRLLLNTIRSQKLKSKDTTS